MNYTETRNYWASDIYFNADTRQEVLEITDDKEIEDRFYKNLEFGTGGLRGFVGAGTNRMNIYTVRKATQGIANYICQAEFPSDVSGVAIAFDSRRMSKEFAVEAACVLAANGIMAHLFEELMPTPILSFAVRHLHCAMGIVITASHNPKEYNGYKVYGMDGGQITDALAGVLSEFISNIEPISNINICDFEKAIFENLVQWISPNVLNSYIGNVLDLSGMVNKEAKMALKIVYSPIHGTGLIPVTRVLREAGFENVIVVAAQIEPDTEFSTVKSPNPEDRKALEMAVALAEEKCADIVIATDPDSDRLGIAVRNIFGDYDYFNGNQLGCLLLKNRLQSLYELGILCADDYIVKTIVTTRMANEIAAEYGVRVIDVLTGFKYIGEKIKEIEENGSGHFIFGFEESYGYLSGTFVRDKDAVIAALMTCETAAYYKQKGQTLSDALKGLYERYGFYLESLKSYIFLGRDGNNKMKGFLESLRVSSWKNICGRKVLDMHDYMKDYGSEKSIFPKSDVIVFEMDNNAWMAIRPSGTEPKLKIYIGVKGKSFEDSELQMQILNKEVDKLIGVQMQ